MDEAPKLPLAGIRVLDVGTLLAGPFGATLLGDFGAEVIKVEQPGSGDNLRGTPVDGVAARPRRWLVDARNKKSITLNLRLERAQAIFRELVACSDVVIENFTPGTLERWNIGWETLRELNPKLVMVRVSGFGQTGPYAKRPGYDRIALGFSGYMYPTGFPDRYPVRPAFPTADYNTATFGAFAAMLALYQRDARGGEGQLIDLALYEAPFRITADLLASFVATGEIRERIGNRNPGFTPAGTFESKDGRLLQIAAGGDNVWRRFAGAMGCPELADDPRYANARERASRADEMEALVAKWCSEHDFEEIDRRLVEANVPVGGINRAPDIIEDPHFRSRESFITVEDEHDGPIMMPGVVPKLSETPGRVAFTGPSLGQHNDDIYRGLLGKPEELLVELAAEGVI